MAIFDPAIFDPAIFDSGTTSHIFDPRIFDPAIFDTGPATPVTPSTGSRAVAAPVLRPWEEDEEALVLGLTLDPF